MAEVQDVVIAILEQGPVAPDQLQALLYLTQAAHLAWFDEPAFDEPILAGPEGPMVASVAQRFAEWGEDLIYLETDIPQSDLPAAVPQPPL